MFCSDAKYRSDMSAVHLQDVDPETGEVLNLTKQEFKDDCDLNVIISRYTPEMLISTYNALQGTFGDYSDTLSYQEARQMVFDTNSWFDSLPAKLRRMFDNDVSKCVDFLENPENRDEAVELGLFTKPLPVKETRAENVPPDPLLDVTGGTDTASVS